MAQLFVSESNSVQRDRLVKDLIKSLDTANGEDFTFDFSYYILVTAEPKELKAFGDNFLTRGLVEFIRKDQRFNDDVVDELSESRKRTLRNTLGINL